MSTCWLTHNIAPQISLHDPPYHKTMKKYENSQGMEAFLFSPLKFAIRTWFFTCPHYLGLFRIVFECSPSIHDQGKMLVLPNQLVCEVPSTSDQCFVSSQPILCHSHTQTRIIIFHDVPLSIPRKPSPNRAAIEFSRIAVPTTVLLKDDRKDFVQEKRLGLPYWTNTSAICVVVDVPICLDIPDWGICSIFGAFSILT